MSSGLANPGRLHATRGQAILAAVLVAVVLAGCGGGSSSVTAGAYVKSICGALGKWKSDVQVAGKQLESTNAGNASPTAAKRDYVSFVTALRAATQRATASLKAAGAPSVTNGKNIANGLSTAFANGTSGLQRAEQQAQSIPTANATVFEAAASAVTAQIRTALQGIAAVSPRKNQALRTAASQQPACQSLSSSTSTG